MGIWKTRSSNQKNNKYAYVSLIEQAINERHQNGWSI